MTGQPGVDHPEEQTEAEVTLTGRGISVSARVDFVVGGVISVCPSVSDYLERVVAAAGDQVQVFWKVGDETRALPAEVLQVEAGTAVPRWRLQVTGPAEVSQRRQAVRGRVVVPLEIGYGSAELTGQTVDLSENGLRAAAEGFGVPPEPGSALDLAIQLEDGLLKVKGETVRVQTRGTRWLLSIRFRGVAEKDGDRIRRRVFQALREERARLRN